MVPATLKFDLDSVMKLCVASVWFLVGSVAVRLDDVMSEQCSLELFFSCGKVSKLQYFILLVCFNECYNTGE